MHQVWSSALFEWASAPTGRPSSAPQTSMGALSYQPHVGKCGWFFKSSSVKGLKLTGLQAIIYIYVNMLILQAPVKPIIFGFQEGQIKFDESGRDHESF